MAPLGDEVWYLERTSLDMYASKLRWGVVTLNVEFGVQVVDSLESVLCGDGKVPNCRHSV